MKVLSYVFVSLLIVTAFSGCGGSSSMSGGGGGNPTTVTVTFTGATPTVVATQIGSGSFTTTTLSSNSVSLEIPTGTTNFAVGYICPTFNELGLTFNDETILMASISDGTSFSQSCPTSVNTPTMGNIAGTVDASAIPGTGAIMLWGIQGNYFTGFGQGSNPIQIMSGTLPIGSDDVFVVAQNEALSNTYAIKQFSSQTVPGELNAGNTVTLTSADQTTPTNITYNNVPVGGSPTSSVSLEPNGESVAIPINFSTTSTFSAVPDSLLTGSAVYQIFSIPSLGTATQMFVLTETNTNSAVIVEFPDAWSCPTIKAAALPTFNFSTYNAFSGMTGVGMEGVYNWNPINKTQNTIFINAYADIVPTSGMLLPDLSAVNSNFLSPPPSGTAVGWIERIDRFSSGQFLNLAVNTTQTEVECHGNYTVP